MTDWQRVGQIADAHRVARVMAEAFSSNDKNRVRLAAADWLSEVAPERVLDLWGGSGSAEVFTKRGLRVLSVEDGRYPETLGLKGPRVRRALELCAEEGGYDWAWGGAEEHAATCDAAFLDVCGHFSGETSRLLRACSHMDRIVLTLMPARVAIGQGLEPGDWDSAYRALLRRCLPDHFPKLLRRYRRKSGHYVFVYAIKKRTAKWTAEVRREYARNYRKPASREYHREYCRKARATDPEYRERQRTLAAVRRLDPEYRKRERERDQATLRANPVRLTQQKERDHNRKVSPKHRDRQRQRWAEDAEYRERRRAQWRAYNERRKASKSGDIPVVPALLEAS